MPRSALLIMHKIIPCSQFIASFIIHFFLNHICLYFLPMFLDVFNIFCVQQLVFYSVKIFMQESLQLYIYMSSFYTILFHSIFLFNFILYITPQKECFLAKYCSLKIKTHNRKTSTFNSKLKKDNERRTSCYSNY